MNRPQERQGPPISRAVAVVVISVTGIVIGPREVGADIVIVIVVVDSAVVVVVAVATVADDPPIKRLLVEVRAAVLVRGSREVPWRER